MNRLFAAGAAACCTLALALAGCDTITGGPLTRPGEPTGTLIIYNNSGGDLDAVVISDCGAMSYGFNRLSDGDYIPPGQEASFTLSAGCWDVGGGEWGGGEAYKRLTVSPGSITRLTIDD